MRGRLWKGSPAPSEQKVRRAVCSTWPRLWEHRPRCGSSGCPKRVSTAQPSSPQPIRTGIPGQSSAMPFALSSKTPFADVGRNSARRQGRPEPARSGVRVRRQQEHHMRDFDEFNITQAVVDRFAETPDPRLRTVITSLVPHLHDLVRHVDLSFAEWRYGMEFLTRTGHACHDKRQEFILLSDTLGVS